jgi:NLR family CARD domain-containing protein 3
LNISFSDVNDNGATVLSHAVGALVQLRILDIDLKCNNIKLQGAKAWGEALSKLKRLNSLTVDFSGYSQAKNNISDDGAAALARAVKNLTRLNTLNLNLGHCNVSDSAVLELAISLRDLNLLRSVTI